MRRSPARLTHRRLFFAGLVCLLLVAVLIAATAGRGLVNPEPASPSDLRSRADRLPSLAWTSGVWTGGSMGAGSAQQFALWRGSRVETATTYPAYETWEELTGSEWHVSVFAGFSGRLVYGLPLLPKAGGSLTDVAAGARDDVWRSVAGDLVKHRFGDSYVRVGLEANGTWFPWGTTASTAGQFIDAFRHVVKVMRDVGPDLRFVFDITCGAGLPGSTGRLDSVTRLYPGDDVVDVVGCDVYDSYTTSVRSAADETNVLRPADAAGLLDVLEFARSHGKLFAVPEWGLTKESAQGAGDNPVFITVMQRFFARNAKYLAFENYFNEPGDYLQSSLWESAQNPAASRVYRRLWTGDEGRKRKDVASDNSRGAGAVN